MREAGENIDDIASSAATAISATDESEQNCEGKLAQVLAPEGSTLTLQDIPESAVRAKFRPDLYRALEPLFESSKLLPDETTLNEHVIFRAEGATQNLIVLFDGHLPCPRAGCKMSVYQEDPASKTLSQTYLVSKGTTFFAWVPPLALFDECGVRSLYFVDALNNKERSPDRFRLDLDEQEVVYTLTAKRIEE